MKSVSIGIQKRTQRRSLWGLAQLTMRRVGGSKSNSPDCELDVVHLTCFYRKILTEAPIEMKRKAFRSEFKRERKGRAFGGCSNSL